MAKLILSDEEKRRKFWGELNDASLGRAVRAIGLDLDKDPDEKSQDWSLMLKAGLVGVCDQVSRTNAEQAEYNLLGITTQGKPLGNWRVTFKRLDEPKPKKNAEDPDSVTLVIRVERMTWPQRVRTCLSGLGLACLSLFCGRFEFKIRKHMLITKFERTKTVPAAREKA